MEEAHQTHLMKMVNTLVEAQLQSAAGESGASVEPQVVLVFTSDAEQYDQYAELHTNTLQEAYRDHSGGEVVVSYVEVDGEEDETSLQAGTCTEKLGVSDQDADVSTVTSAVIMDGAGDSVQEGNCDRFVDAASVVTGSPEIERKDAIEMKAESVDGAEVIITDNTGALNIGEDNVIDANKDNMNRHSDNISEDSECKDRKYLSNSENDTGKTEHGDRGDEIEDSANKKNQEGIIGNRDDQDKNRGHNNDTVNHIKTSFVSEVVDEDNKEADSCTAVTEQGNDASTNNSHVSSNLVVKSPETTAADSLLTKGHRRKGRPRKHEGIKIVKMECPLLKVSATKLTVPESVVKPSEIKSESVYIGTRRRMKALEMKAKSSLSESTVTSKKMETQTFKRNSSSNKPIEIQQKPRRRKGNQSPAFDEIKKPERRNSSIDELSEFLKRPRGRNSTLVDGHAVTMKSRTLKRHRGRKIDKDFDYSETMKKGKRKKGNCAVKFTGAPRKYAGRKRTQTEEPSTRMKKPQGRRKKEVRGDITESEVSQVKKLGNKEKGERWRRDKTPVSKKRKSDTACPVTPKRTRGKSKKNRIVNVEEKSRHVQSELGDTEKSDIQQQSAKTVSSFAEIQNIHGIITQKKDISKNENIEEQLEAESNGVIAVDSGWDCAVCAQQFDDPAVLSQHHLTHSAEDLSHALCMLQAKTPPKRCKSKFPGKKGRKTKAVSSKEEDHLPEELCQTVLTTEDEVVANKSVTVKEEEPAECASDKDIWNDEWNNDSENFEWPDDSNSFWGLQSEAEGEEETMAIINEHTETENNVRKVSVSKDNTEKKQRRNRRKINGLGSRDPHICAICGKTLSSRGNLTKHLILHNTAKPWMCDKCGVGFNAKRDFGHHMMQKHTGERPFVCEVCGKGFVYKNYLTEHANYHTSEKPYICELCGKYFASVNCLKKHQKRHTGERPYVCGLCGKAFAIRYDLTAHMKSVHEGMKKKLNSSSESPVKSQIDDDLQLVNVSPSTILPDNLDAEPLPQNTNMHSECVYETVLPVVTHPSSLPGPTTVQAPMLLSEAGISNVPTITTAAVRGVHQEVVASAGPHHTAAQQMIVMQYM